MSELINGREFQLWEYQVSHGSLLIRSPAGLRHKSSIDIICVGVEYLAAPRHLGRIAITTASEIELTELEAILCKKVPRSSVWALQGPNRRFLIVAAALSVQEHRGDIFQSPFRL